MEPNYSEYSIAELEDVLNRIDKEAHIERVEQIKNELASRQSIEESAPEKVEDDFEPNEQFFRCPSCEKKIGFFSKTANKWGKKKVCPHCNSSFESFIKMEVYAFAVIPALFFHLFFSRPLAVSLGLNGAIITGILCGIISMLAMRYRKIHGSNAI